MLLQRLLIGVRDHFGDAERGTSIYKVFKNALVATSWKAWMQLNYITRNRIRIQ